MPITEVFESDLRLPSRVCVLAPGPRGRGHYHEIPEDCFVISVSKAVLIPEVDADLWMMNHAHQPWVAEANAAFHGIRVWEQQAVAEAGDAVADLDDLYSFTSLRDELALRAIQNVDGVIRNGGTISGCAIQFAYNFGAREILLCGLDLSGDAYFDDTLNVQPQHHGETWRATDSLDALVRWLVEERGIKVATLSPTKLAVPAYRLAN